MPTEVGDGDKGMNEFVGDSSFFPLKYDSYICFKLMPLYSVSEIICNHAFSNINQVLEVYVGN